MNKIYLLLLFLFPLLPSCSPKRIHTKKERKRINQATDNRINKAIIPDNFEYKFSENDHVNSHGISMHDAISIALEYNPSLQANLESLGIAKADLVQAGILSNPNLESSFKAPRPNYTNQHAKVELDLSFAISDLWQIPRRKKVAQDELEITSMRIINTIINIFTTTKITYYNALHASAQLSLAQKIFDESKILKDRFLSRQQMGYSSELDTSMAEVMMQHWLIEVTQAKDMLYMSYRELEKILGIVSTTQPILLTEIFDIPSIELPSLKDLEKYAIENRPELQIARLHLQKADDQIKYEQSLFIPSVECGLSYEREVDKKKIVGSLLNITLPLFDTNYAQIAKAKAQKKKFQQEYYSTLKATLTEVKQLYNKYNAKKQALEYYQKMIPSFEDALSYIKKNMQNMQLTILLFYQTRIRYYEEKRNNLTTQLELLTTYAQLEEAIGKQLSPSTICSNKAYNSYLK